MALSKTQRLAKFDAALAAKDFTDEELAQAQAILSGLTAIKTKPFTLTPIPMKGGFYGFTGQQTVEIGGESVTLQTTAVHPLSKAASENAMKAMHVLAARRREGLSTVRSKENTINAVSKLSAQEKRELAAKLLQEIATDDDSEGEEDEDGNQD